MSEKTHAADYPFSDPSLQTAESAGHRVAARLPILEMVPKNGVCAEIGVFTGLFSAEIIRATTPKKFHMVDPWWLAYGDTFPDWGPYTANGKLRTETAHDAAVARTSIPREQGDRDVHVGFSAPWLAKMPDDYFDWVYIDSSHEEKGTFEELSILSTKMKKGGIIIGDDWWTVPGNHHFGVFKAVQRFCNEQEFEIFHCDHTAQWAVRRRTWK